MDNLAKMYSLVFWDVVQTSSVENIFSEHDAGVRMEQEGLGMSVAGAADGTMLFVNPVETIQL